MTDPITERLHELKALRNAVILAHYYQRGEVQDAADYVGDSLGLSRQAAQTDADVILFCGVHFMAETAAILCPDQPVIVPDVHAGCPMADMVTVRELNAMKAAHGGVCVVAYVNTSAAVKAESDICCTSANAVNVLKSVADRAPVLFVPDRNLADYAAAMSGVAVIPWPGYCPTHARILPRDILAQKEKHPNARVMCHPECRREVRALADCVASTAGMLRDAAESDAIEFIVGTEIGFLHALEKQCPEKDFHAATQLADCPNMKLNSIEKMVWALEDMAPQVTVPDKIADRARTAIERMLAIA